MLIYLILFQDILGAVYYFEKHDKNFRLITTLSGTQLHHVVYFCNSCLLLITVQNLRSFMRLAHHGTNYDPFFLFLSLFFEFCSFISSLDAAFEKFDSNFFSQSDCMTCQTLAVMIFWLVVCLTGMIIVSTSIFSSPGSSPYPSILSY